MTIVICKKCKREELMYGLGLCHSCYCGMKMKENPNRDEVKKEWCKKNKEKLKDYYKEYYKKYPEKYKKAQKKYDEKIKEKKNAKQKVNGNEDSKK